MLAISNILVPVVFSRNCAWSARYAARLAKEFGSQLVFLHVGQDSNANTLEDFVSNEVGTRGHKSVVVGGDPAERIVELAGEYRADLIVMPTYHGRFRTFLIGSVTAKVLHDVDCPVLTGIHHYDRPPQVPETFSNIVCAVSDAPGCAPLFRWARDFATRVGAQLRLVHAMPAVDEVSENCGETDIRKYLTTQARDSFSARLAAESDPPSVDLHGGEIGTVIREAALADHADLVVIGRGHADRALGRLRSQSYSIIRNSPCPVISV